LSRRRSLEVLRDRFHFASRRGATAVLTRGVHTTRRDFSRRATPTSGLGWSIWSTSALRRRLNAAALLVSGGHPYSLAIPVYYGPPRLSPEQRQGVSRLVSGGLDVTWAVNPSASGPWPTPTRGPVCLHASIRSSVTSYPHTTLAVVVRLLARRLGLPVPISPIRLLSVPGFRPEPSFGLGLATASTSSGLPTSATPHLVLFGNVGGGQRRAVHGKAPAAVLAWTVLHHTATLPPSQEARFAEEGAAVETVSSSNPFPVVLPRVP